jgi:hypothetical protein
MNATNFFYRALGLGFTLLATSSYAQGRSIEGMYESKDHWKTTQVFIKTIEERGVESSYALIVWQDDQTSLFKIEDVDGATQAWIQIFQGKDYVLGSDLDSRATFSAQFAMDRNGIVSQLSISPTGFGEEIGCKGSYLFTQKAGESWQSLQLQNPEIRHVTDSRFKGTLTQVSQSNQYIYRGMSANGKLATWSVLELLPGLGTMREVRLDTESIEGRSMTRPISHVVVSIRRNFFFHQYDEVRMIQLKPGQKTCGALTGIFVN